MLSNIDKTLADYIANIKSSYKISGQEVKFPSKKALGKGPEEQLTVLVQQAEKLLDSGTSFSILGNNLGLKDRKQLISIFVKDIKQFATAHKIKIGNKPIAYYAQSKISDHAFFHLASSSILPKTYETIDLNEHANTFDIYSIPFKIRISLENKLKNIIGFRSCDIKRHGRERIGVSEIPFSMVIQELIKLKCLNLPCSLSDLLNIYFWSCSFCHTGEKEYIWMSMKAIDIISSLFLYDEQKKFEIKVTKLWLEHELSDELLIEKLENYKGFTTPLYYLKNNWSIEKLQSSLNKTKNKSLKPYTFYLSEEELEEAQCFYCSQTKVYV